jgi:hypothetical protein
VAIATLSQCPVRPCLHPEPTIQANLLLFMPSKIHLEKKLETLLSEKIQNGGFF